VYAPPSQHNHTNDTGTEIYRQYRPTWCHRRSSWLAWYLEFKLEIPSDRLSSSAEMVIDWFKSFSLAVYHPSLSPCHISPLGSQNTAFSLSLLRAAYIIDHTYKVAYKRVAEAISLHQRYRKTSCTSNSRIDRNRKSLTPSSTAEAEPLLLHRQDAIRSLAQNIPSLSLYLISNI
jgi:hypothetical protein